MKKINFINNYFAIALIGAFIFSGCKDEEMPDIVNESELITTISLQFEAVGTGDVSTFTFRDIDGPGGALPTQFDTIRLAAGTDYYLTTTLLNESVIPTIDISAEVTEEGVDHQFFYTVGEGLNLVVTYNDTDANGNPIGIVNNVVSGDASNGTLTVVLKHQPGIKDGDIATGDTDVEVVFDCKIN